MNLGFIPKVQIRSQIIPGQLMRACDLLIVAGKDLAREKRDESPPGSMQHINPDPDWLQVRTRLSLHCCMHHNSLAWGWPGARILVPRKASG